jgi:lactate permease
MGSSYNAIQLVTKIPGDIIGPCMALIFFVSIFSTGLSVAHIYGGIKELKRSVPLVLLIGAIMSGTMWLMNHIGVAQLASLAAGIIGCVALSLVAFFRRNNDPTSPTLAPVRSGMSFTAAASPYYAVILITMISQVPAIRTALPPYSLSLDYPEISTALGYSVEAVSGYSKIRLFSHPAPILFVSAVFGIILYSLLNARGQSGWQLLAKAASGTVKKCIPTSSGIATMVMMALVMSDSGMTNYIARGVAAVFGKAYLIASPFVGALGTFITGSNTNSNIMFGIMQYDTAIVLGQSAILMAASQSVGGSLGVSIAPSTIMMGSANVGIIGRESEVLRRTIKYGLINITLTGLFVWFLGGYYN